MSRRLQFSIGPVQAFVGQSRRLRDLWASSYLLSFLAASAIHGARSAGGAIVRPDVSEDPLLAWAEGNGCGQPPRFGSIPNQFEVDVANGDAAAIAASTVASFNDAWKRICDAVWERFFAQVESFGRDTAAIWKRQTTGFWELTWVIGDEAASDLLARRKLWRTHWMPEEPGDKCTLMSDYQELSGYLRIGERASQERFWQSVRTNLKNRELEIRDGTERLCAIAAVKRFYPLVFAEAIGWDLDVTHWDSTIDVAARNDADAVYYAMLLADGDRLGSLNNAIGSQRVGAALAEFTRGIPKIIGDASGDLVYAGGDDVFALLPLKGALECAQRLERSYRAAFGPECPGATLSTALLFTHSRAPITSAIAEAHRLLDREAKDRNGRSSIAVGVYRSGGTESQWVTTWERCGGQAMEMLGALGAALGGRQELSHGLVGDLRHDLTRLSGRVRATPGLPLSLDLDIDELRSLVRADVEHRLASDSTTAPSGGAPGVASLAELIVDVLPVSRANGSMGSLEISIDALALARFIAGGGVESGHRG